MSLPTLFPSCYRPRNNVTIGPVTMTVGILTLLNKDTGCLGGGRSLPGTSPPLRKRYQGQIPRRYTTQYWTASHVAGMLSLDTSLVSPKTRQLTKHSGVAFTYLSDAFLIKAGSVVQAAQAKDGSIRSAGTTTHHQFICGGDPSFEVIRGWRYGLCQLGVNDDDDTALTKWSVISLTGNRNTTFKSFVIEIYPPTGSHQWITSIGTMKPKYWNNQTQSVWFFSFNGKVGYFTMVKKWHLQIYVSNDNADLQCFYKWNWTAFHKSLYYLE